MNSLGISVIFSFFKVLVGFRVITKYGLFYDDSQIPRLIKLVFTEIK